MNLTITLNQTISISFMKLPNEPFLIFLIINIIQILFSSIGIIGSIFFLLTIFFNRSFHTLSNILTCNSSLAVLILASDMFSIAVYVLYRDLSTTKVKMHNMFLCHVRAYLSHTGVCALVHSFVIQAFYRLAGTVYYNRLYYQSLRPYLYMMTVQWFIAIGQSLPIAITNSQIFVEEEYLCQIAIDQSRVILCVCTIVYFIPLSLIFIQYLIIARYARRKDLGIRPLNIQQRIYRQMKLIRRILILITILLVLGIPYCTIIILDALALVPAPRYAHRLGFLFMGIACGCIMLMMIGLTRNLRLWILEKRQNRKKNNRQQTRYTLKTFKEILQSESI